MMIQFLSVSSPVIADSISKICVHASSIADNTSFGTIDAISFVIAILALISGLVALLYSHLTYVSQKKTEKHTETTQGNTARITLLSQKGLLVDMVRHLYRNLVVTYAINTKLEHYGYEKCYPSEEHLIKLKSPIENIHLDAFYSNEELYKKMNHLYLLLRNYNTEIDISLRHFPQNGLDINVKKRDMATLMYKPGLLVENIKSVLELMCPNENVPLLLAKEINNSFYGNQHRPHGSEWQYTFREYDVSQSQFITAIFSHVNLTDNVNNNFLEMFNADAYLECGKNETDSDKIYMIMFN